MVAKQRAIGRGRQRRRFGDNILREGEGRFTIKYKRSRMFTKERNFMYIYFCINFGTF